MKHLMMESIFIWTPVMLLILHTLKIQFVLIQIQTETHHELYLIKVKHAISYTIEVP